MRSPDRSIKPFYLILCILLTVFLGQAVHHQVPAICPETDQRGVERPQSDACDIGA